MQFLFPPHLRRRVFHTLFLSMFLVGGLTACGSDSKTSSGSGKSTGHAGFYSGSGTFAVTGPAGTEHGGGTITFRINDNGIIVIDPHIKPNYKGKVNGNQFTIIIPGSFLNSPGFSCSGSIFFKGTVNNGRISGTVSSSQLLCNGAAGSITGEFTAARSTSASSSSADGYESLLEALGHALPGS